MSQWDQEGSWADSASPALESGPVSSPNHPEMRMLSSEERTLQKALTRLEAMHVSEELKESFGETCGLMMRASAHLEVLSREIFKLPSGDVNRVELSQALTALRTSITRVHQTFDQLVEDLDEVPLSKRSEVKGLLSHVLMDFYRNSLGNLTSLMLTPGFGWKEVERAFPEATVGLKSLPQEFDRRDALLEKWGADQLDLVS